MHVKDAAKRPDSRCLDWRRRTPAKSDFFSDGKLFITYAQVNGHNSRYLTDLPVWWRKHSGQSILQGPRSKDIFLRELELFDNKKCPIIFVPDVEMVTTSPVYDAVTVCQVSWGAHMFQQDARPEQNANPCSSSWTCPGLRFGCCVRWTWAPSIMTSGVFCWQK